MPLLRGIFKRSGVDDDDGWWKNCCKAPEELAITPPLPPQYSAWIHRCGWILYVHNPTKQSSWMHPVRLANFEAKGMEGPGKYGPEMWIFERNVNRGGHYCVDYGYPPMGRIKFAQPPFPRDFKVMDQIGYEAWREQTIEKTRARLGSQAKGGDAMESGPGEMRNEDDASDNDQAKKSEDDRVSQQWDDPEWRREYRIVKNRILEEQGVATIDLS